MKKGTCKHKAIAKGNGERYWKCIFCGQKVADPVQLTNKKMRNKNQKENWEKYPPDKKSKYWNELVDVLEKEFPKGRCKERGHALVLLAYAEMYLQEAEKEKEKLYDWCFKKCGEEKEASFKQGYNQAIEDLEKLKSQLKDEK